MLWGTVSDKVYFVEWALITLLDGHLRITAVGGSVWNMTIGFKGCGSRLLIEEPN